MQFLDIKNRFVKDTIIDVRNVINCFGNLDRRRLYEWQKKNYIKKVTSNYYIFTDNDLDDNALKQIANKIYSPSYVALESALAYYRLIPEAVFQINSISTRKTKLIKTDFAEFRYRSVNKQLFWGYDLVVKDDNKFLISCPEKTILDYLYLNPHLKDQDSLRELRINAAEIHDILNLQKLKNYLNIFHNKQLNDRVNLLLEVLNVKPG